MGTAVRSQLVSLELTLGSTQPLTEMSTRSISWGKDIRCVRLTTLPPSCAVVMNSGNLNFLEPSGPLQACNGTALPLPLHLLNGDRGGTVVKVLCYKSEDRWFDPSWCHWNWPWGRLSL